jgi:DNA repair protein RadC
MVKYRAIYEARREAACGCQPEVPAPLPTGRTPWPGEGARVRVATPTVNAPRTKFVEREDVALVSVGAVGCRPFMRKERDQPKFAACQKIAEAIGEIDDAKKAAKILIEAVGGNVAEKFGVLTLSTHLHMIGIWETGAGEIDAVMAPRVPTLNAAISDLAAAAVIYHLHPGASDYPSDSDIDVTKDFNRAFNEVGILMMDHIIVAAGSAKGYYSFLESMPESLEIPKR